MRYAYVDAGRTFSKGNHDRLMTEKIAGISTHRRGSTNKKTEVGFGSQAVDFVQFVRFLVKPGRASAPQQHRGTFRRNFFDRAST